MRAWFKNRASMTQSHWNGFFSEGHFQKNFSHGLEQSGPRFLISNRFNSWFPIWRSKHSFFLNSESVRHKLFFGVHSGSGSDQVIRRKSVMLIMMLVTSSNWWCFWKLVKDLRSLQHIFRPLYLSSTSMWLKQVFKWILNEVIFL